MRFTKMHGCGNDYIYVDAAKEMIEHPSDLAIRLSDRHFGIGSDGLILICPSGQADFRMRMYNADGSEAEMCGNGIRCVAKYVYDKGLTDKTSISIETGAGVKQLTLHPGANGLIQTVTVDMGTPILDPAQIPVCLDHVINQPIQVAGREYRITCVSMGNPHAVVFLEDTDLASFPIEQIGPQFECHPCFPKRTNTEFIQLISRNEIRMRVWERGSGETLACGTGTCASVMAGILNQKTDDRVLVHLLGGDLEIFYDRESGHIQMTGPATTVFEGEI
ncbi:MAG: diaminopimelate epimerase [Lachnospiraceae bacterium]|nr:diaminopimelate epimerase [Lachnospiraceae bacterium]